MNNCHAPCGQNNDNNEISISNCTVVYEDKCINPVVIHIFHELIVSATDDNRNNLDKSENLNIF
jgi:hypothetical protein